VRAHVGEAVDPVARVAREHERLVERAWYERERVDLPRDLHEVVVTGVLPGAREHAVALRAEELGIGVHARRQRARNADVGVDLECRVAHQTVMLSSGARLDTCGSSP